MNIKLSFAAHVMRECFKFKKKLPENPEESIVCMRTYQTSSVCKKKLI